MTAPDHVVVHQTFLLRNSGRPHMAALVAVEDFGFSMVCQGFLDRLEAEINLQGDRDTPGQNPPTEPVEHNNQINKTARHLNVGDIRCPDLVRTLNLDVS